MGEGIFGSGSGALVAAILAAIPEEAKQAFEAWAAQEAKTIAGKIATDFIASLPKAPLIVGDPTATGTVDGGPGA